MAFAEEQKGMYGPVARGYRIVCWAALTATILLGLAAVPASAQRYNFATYTQDEGLGDLNVHSIYQDHEGFLWAGTEGGLYRYDGKSFQAFSLNERGYSTYISKILEDQAGRLWVSADTGLYVIENGVARSVEMNGKPLVVDRSVVPAAIEPDGVVVIANKQLWAVQRRGGEWRVEAVRDAQGTLAGTKLNALAQGGVGKLWLGTDQGVIQFDRRIGQVVRMFEDHAAARPVQGNWNIMMVDHTGDVWMRGTRGISRLHVNQGRIEDLTTSGGVDLSKDSDFDLAEDADGRVLTLHEEGIVRWEGKSWHVFGRRAGMREFPSCTLMVDHDGDVWIGQIGHGLRKWRGYGLWEYWADGEGLGNPVVWGMARDGAGRMIVADFKRLNVREGQETDFAPLPGALPTGRGARAVVRAGDGAVWSGGGGTI